MDTLFGSLLKPGDSLPWFSWLLEYFWWLLGGLLGPLGSPSASWTASGTLLPLLGPPVPLELSWQVLGGSWNALGHFARFWAALGRFRITLPESHGTPITLLETHCTPDQSSRATWHPWMASRDHSAGDTLHPGSLSSQGISFEGDIVGLALAP